jgi:O-antigen ligase
MNNELRQLWSRRLDRTCAIAGSLTPVGLVIGNIGFEFIVALVIVVWLIRRVVVCDNSFRFLRRHSLVIPWAAWFIAIIISVGVNGPGSKGFTHDIAFIRYLFFGMALLDTARRVAVSRYLVYGLAAGVIWAAMNTLCAHVSGCDLIGKPLVRYTAKLKEAARIAGMMAYAAPFFLAWGLMDKELRPQKKIAAIAIGLTAFALLLVIHIRTDLLAAAAGIFVISAYFAFKRASLMTAALSTIILVSVTALFFLSGNMLDLTSFYDRIYYWKVSWALWLDHPVFGVGVSSFQDAYKHKAASGTISAYIAPTGQVFKEAAAYSAHSLILMLLACTGISGFAAFVWLFVKAFQRILSDLSGFRIGLLTWPAVLSVLGITGCNIYHSWYQALFAFFIVLIGSNIGNQNEPQKESI